MACVLEADDPIYTDADHPLKLGIELLVVDEGHDLNRAMFTVMQHLIRCNPIKQVFVVGDTDQVVHSDGGADKTFMNEAFVREIGRAAELPLETCWRFGESLAGPLARHAGKSYSALQGTQTRVEIYEVANVQALATLIDGAYQSAQADSGAKSPSLSVLLRHPGATVQLESALVVRGYSTETYGFEPFSQRPEILFLRALVAWATENIDTLAQLELCRVQRAIAEFTGCMSHKRFRDVRFSDLRTFHKQFLGELQVFLTRPDTGDVRPIINFSDGDALVILRRFLFSLREIGPQELWRLVEDMRFNFMAKRAFVFDEQVEEAMASMLDFARSAAEFENFEAWLSMLSQRDAEVRRGRARGGKIIRLYSIQAAKGLEFDHVIIPDVSVGSFDGSQQEERNLFYVATSRARKRLTMTYSRRPSSFLSPFGRPEDWGSLT